MCEGGGETAEFRKEVALDGQGPHGACGGGWNRSITARTLADDLIFSFPRYLNTQILFSTLLNALISFAFLSEGVCVSHLFPPLSL